MKLFLFIIILFAGIVNAQNSTIEEQQSPESTTKSTKIIPTSKNVPSSCRYFSCPACMYCIKCNGYQLSCCPNACKQNSPEYRSSKSLPFSTISSTTTTTITVPTTITSTKIIPTSKNVPSSCRYFSCPACMYCIECNGYQLSCCPNACKQNSTEYRSSKSLPFSTISSTTTTTITVPTTITSTKIIPTSKNVPSSCRYFPCPSCMNCIECNGYQLSCCPHACKQNSPEYRSSKSLPFSTIFSTTTTTITVPTTITSTKIIPTSKNVPSSCRYFSCPACMYCIECNGYQLSCCPNACKQNSSEYRSSN